MDYDEFERELYYEIENAMFENDILTEEEFNKHIYCIGLDVIVSLLSIYEEHIERFVSGYYESIHKERENHEGTDKDFLIDALREHFISGITWERYAEHYNLGYLSEKNENQNELQ